MSRPHDGHSMFPYFSSTFRMVSPKRSSNELDQTLNAFETVLVERLKQLKPKNPKGFLTLLWMQQAFEVMSATHKDLTFLIRDLQFPATEWDKKWVDQYLDDTLKLMDICIALNAEISKLEESQLLVQHGRIRKEEGKFFCSNPMRNGKIENCTMILQGLRKGLQFGKVKSSSKGKVFSRAMHGVKATTIFVCSVVGSALYSSPGPLIEVEVPDQFLWSAAFMGLQKEVHEEIKTTFANGGAGVLKELEIMDAAIESMYSAVEKVPPEFFDKTGESKYEKVRVAIEELQRSVQFLAQGLDPLTKQVNDFFQIVLNGRNKLLDSLRLSGNEDAHRGDDFLVKLVRKCCPVLIISWSCWKNLQYQRLYSGDFPYFP